MPDFLSQFSHYLYSPLHSNFTFSLHSSIISFHSTMIHLTIALRCPKLGRILVLPGLNITPPLRVDSKWLQEQAHTARWRMRKVRIATLQDQLLHLLRPKLRLYPLCSAGPRQPAGSCQSASSSAAWCPICAVCKCTLLCFYTGTVRRKVFSRAAKGRSRLSSYRGP